MMTLLFPIGTTWCARVYRRCACRHAIVLVATAAGDLDYCRRVVDYAYSWRAPEVPECCLSLDEAPSVKFPPRSRTFTRQKPSAGDV